MEWNITPKCEMQSLNSKSDECYEELQSSKFMDQLIYASYNSGFENEVNLSYLKDGLSKKIFSPVTAINSIVKLPLGRTMRCFVSALDVTDYCVGLLRTTKLSKPPEICKAISKVTYWLLENSIEIYKLLYSCMKDPGIFLPDTSDCTATITKVQNLLQKLICTEEYQDLNFIGKLLFGEDEKTPLQIQMRELLSFQLDKIKTHVCYDAFETLLKDFMKLITRFLNPSTWGINDSGKRPYAMQSLNIFMQFQILLCLPLSGSKLANFFDMFLKVEGIPVDQMLLAMYQLATNSILTRSDQFEVNMFIAFLFLKLPVIYHCLEKKSNVFPGEQSLVYRTLLEVSKLKHTAIDNLLGCNTFNAFVMQCEAVQPGEGRQLKSLVKLEEVDRTPENVVVKFFDAAKKCDDILKVFALPVDTNMEKLNTELQTLLNENDLVIWIIAFAATDKLQRFINCLLGINLFTQKPTDSKDVRADTRADLFNNSFLLLSFIDVRFENKAFLDVPGDLQKSFYFLWRSKCTLVTSRKLYNQTVFDKMMGPLTQQHQPAVNNAQWDEYCWGAGMAVKELTQAHLRRHFTTEALQKVCEGFKNRRPALCICALVWLCTQYKTMPHGERSRTAKIINLFRRPLQNASKTSLWTPILQKYSLSLEADLLAANTKSKTVLTEPYEVNSLKLSNLLTTAPGLMIDYNFMTKITEMQAAMGTSYFIESLIKLILLNGKEEEALALEAICTGVLFIQPLECVKEIFQNTLKHLFFYGGAPSFFAEPQGSCLSKCLSKTLAMASSLYICEDGSTTKIVNLPVKSIAVERYQIDQIIAKFLEESLLMLTNHEENAVTMFIIHLINDVATIGATLKTPFLIKNNKIIDLLRELRPKFRRDTLALLCNLSSREGVEKAADILCW